MAKKVIVGGRIESKEVGGIVTGAAEILDDSKGKKQSVINQETDAELLRMDQSKQNNLTFDNTPTEGSDNPVKSGGLYTAQQAILLAIAAINELIPSAASVLNQLADKAFVNSSVSTNTATFRGTSAAGLNEQQFIVWANGLEHDLNDYVFWQTSDTAGNTLFKRYKWNGTEWAYEYTLNNSTFTAEQWEAIQSGITALLVTKLRALPTAQELIQSFDGKQDVLTFDNVPTLGSTNPVKSSGIYNAIDSEKTRAQEAEQALGNLIAAIRELIPSEATAQNQLADKADVAAKILAAIPSWKGQYDALTDLQAVTGAKAGDMGCVKTTDSDGHAVLTFYQYSAQGAWVEYYTLRHYAQNKPATTGTTGDYPYNGMGRIELQKNIVNGVNTLTQAMFTQHNTIYVIQYDFTLGENITVPANCVLEFEGGSISGGSIILNNGTKVHKGILKNVSFIIVGSDVLIEDCSIVNTTKACIEVNTITLMDARNNIIIRNNLLQTSYDGSGSVQGCAIRWHIYGTEKYISNNIQITNNIIKYTYMGFEVAGSGQSSATNAIKNCIIDSNYFEMLTAVNTSKYFAISLPDQRATQQYTNSNIVISNNTVECNSIGRFAEIGGEKFLIVNNTTRNDSSGTILASPNSNLDSKRAIRDTIISNNTFGNSLNLSDCENISIISNVLAGALYIGDSSTTVPRAKNIIVRDNAINIGSLGLYSLRLANFDFILIDNNYCKSSWGNGFVWFYSGYQKKNFIFKNNRLLHTGETMYFIVDGVEGDIILNNYLENSDTWYDGMYEQNVKFGPSNKRPGVSNLVLRIGYEFFDTSLNKPIYVKQISGSTVTWIDATGATV